MTVRAGWGGGGGGGGVIITDADSSPSRFLIVRDKSGPIIRQTDKLILNNRNENHSICFTDFLTDIPSLLLSSQV